LVKLIAEKKGGGPSLTLFNEVSRTRASGFSKKAIREVLPQLAPPKASRVDDVRMMGRMPKEDSSRWGGDGDPVINALKGNPFDEPNEAARRALRIQLEEIEEEFPGILQSKEMEPKIGHGVESPRDSRGVQNQFGVMDPKTGKKELQARTDIKQEWESPEVQNARFEQTLDEWDDKDAVRREVKHTGEPASLVRRKLALQDAMWRAQDQKNNYKANWAFNQLRVLNEVGPLKTDALQESLRSGVPFVRENIPQQALQALDDDFKTVDQVFRKASREADAAHFKDPTAANKELKNQAFKKYKEDVRPIVRDAVRNTAKMIRENSGASGRYFTKGDPAGKAWREIADMSMRDFKEKYRGLSDNFHNIFFEDWKYGLKDRVPPGVKAYLDKKLMGPASGDTKVGEFMAWMEYDLLSQKFPAVATLAKMKGPSYKRMLKDPEGQISLTRKFVEVKDADGQVVLRKDGKPLMKTIKGRLLTSEHKQMVEDFRHVTWILRNKYDLKSTSKIPVSDKVGSAIRLPRNARSPMLPPSPRDDVEMGGPALLRPEGKALPKRNFDHVPEKEPPDSPLWTEREASEKKGRLVGPPRHEDYFQEYLQSKGKGNFTPVGLMEYVRQRRFAQKDFPKAKGTTYTMPEPRFEKTDQVPNWVKTPLPEKPEQSPIPRLTKLPVQEGDGVTEQMKREKALRALVKVSKEPRTVRIGEWTTAPEDAIDRKLKRERIALDKQSRKEKLTQDRYDGIKGASQKAKAGVPLEREKAEALFDSVKRRGASLPDERRFAQWAEVASPGSMRDETVQREAYAYWAGLSEEEKLSQLDAAREALSRPFDGKGI
jgi:hypothetical protein